MPGRPEDRAGAAYWDGVWREADLPRPVDPGDHHFRNRMNRVFAAYFDPILSALPPGARVLEVGCGRSAWLPYFAARYGSAIAGIDYSQAGCEAEREILRRAGVEAEIVQADLFDPPPGLLGRFDLVLSLGVVEHFDDTAACLEAVSRFARPGGRVVTTIPNMIGAAGALQRLLNPAVFEIHRPMGPRGLAAAHDRAGLAVESSGYLLSNNFGVVNLQGLPEGGRRRRLEFLLLQLTRLTKLVWLIEDRLGALPATRALAGFVAVTATRPIEQGAAG